LKARRRGQGKPFLEQKVGDDLHRKTGTWNRLERVIDREHDRYREHIVDPQSGAVLRDVDEPLSQHHRTAPPRARAGGSGEGVRRP
jgi:hypothetical protein